MNGWGRGLFLRKARLSYPVIRSGRIGSISRTVSKTYRAKVSRALECGEPYREKEYTQEPTIRGHSWWSQSERELSNGVSEDYTLSRLSLSSKTDSFSTRFVCDQLSRFLLWLMSISRNVILYPSPYFDCSSFSAESRTEWTIPSQGIKRRGTEQNINYLYLSSEPWDYYSTTDFCVVFLMDWSGILSRRSSIPTAERLGYKIRTYLVLL